MRMWMVIFYVDIGTQVQSLVYTILDYSLATKCFMAKIETSWCRMREACEPNAT